MSATILLLTLASTFSSSAYAPSSVLVDDAEIVIPLTTDFGHLDIEVYFGDRGPFQFQLDTYASPKICIDDDLAKELGLEVVDSVQNSDGRTTKQVDLVEVEDFRVGSTVSGGVRALVDDYEHVSDQGQRLQGLIGFSLFDDYLMTIDYASRRIVLRKGELSKSQPGVLPIRTRNRVPNVMLSLGGKRLEFGVDTGAAQTLSLFEKDLERFDVFGDAPVVARARTVYSTYDIRGGFLDETVEFAGLEFTAVYAHFSEARAATIRLIGYGFFQDCVLTFDQKNRLLQFERKPLPPTIQLNTEELESWTGHFGKKKRSLTIKVRDGQLFVRVLDGPELLALPISDDELAFEGNAMRLRRGVEEKDPLGIMVSGCTDLSGTWFASSHN